MNMIKRNGNLPPDEQPSERVHYPKGHAATKMSEALDYIHELFREDVTDMSAEELHSYARDLVKAERLLKDAMRLAVNSSYVFNRDVVERYSNRLQAKGIEVMHLLQLSQLRTETKQSIPSRLRITDEKDANSPINSNLNNSTPKTQAPHNRSATKTHRGVGLPWMPDIVLRKRDEHLKNVARENPADGSFFGKYFSILSRRRGIKAPAGEAAPHGDTSSLTANKPDQHSAPTKDDKKNADAHKKDGEKEGEKKKDGEHDKTKSKGEEKKAAY